MSSTETDQQRVEAAKDQEVVKVTGPLTVHESGSTFAPTARLRWASRPIPRRYKDRYQVLQQEWVDREGNVEWRDVEIVEEESET